MTIHKTIFISNYPDKLQTLLKENHEFQSFKDEDNKKIGFLLHYFKIEQDNMEIRKYSIFNLFEKNLHLNLELHLTRQNSTVVIFLFFQNLNEESGEIELQKDQIFSVFELLNSQEIDYTTPLVRIYINSDLLLYHIDFVKWEGLSILSNDTLNTNILKSILSFDDENTGKLGPSLIDHLVHTITI